MTRNTKQIGREVRTSQFDSTACMSSIGLNFILWDHTWVPIAKLDWMCWQPPLCSSQQAPGCPPLLAQSVVQFSASLDNGWVIWSCTNEANTKKNPSAVPLAPRPCFLHFSMAMLPCHPPCLLLTLSTGRPKCTTTTTTSFVLGLSTASSMILIVRWPVESALMHMSRGCMISPRALQGSKKKWRGAKRSMSTGWVRSRRSCRRWLIRQNKSNSSRTGRSGGAIKRHGQVVRPRLMAMTSYFIRHQHQVGSCHQAGSVLPHPQENSSYSFLLDCLYFGY